MARQKGWVWISLAILCAIGAAALSFYVLGQEVSAAQQRAVAGLAPTPAPIPTIKLPVAANNLAGGQTLAEGDYVLKDFPLDLAPSNAITTTEVLDGQLLMQPVAEGDIFRSQLLVGNADAPVSGSIEQGKVLFALPATDLMGQAGLIQQGDHVDVLLSLPRDQEGLLTGYTIENVEVFRVLAPAKSEEDPAPQPTGYVLLLRPEDVVVVKATLDHEGPVDMTLRSPKDTELFNAPALDTADLEGLMSGSGQRANGDR